MKFPKLRFNNKQLFSTDLKTGLRFPEKARIFIFATTPRPALEFTQLLSSLLESAGSFREGKAAREQSELKSFLHSGFTERMQCKKQRVDNSVYIVIHVVLNEVSF